MITEKAAVAGVMCALVLPFFLHAQPTPPPTIEVLLAQIQILQAKVAQLKAAEEAPLASIPNLNRHLRHGMSGDDIRSLQTFLRKFPELYPEGLVTGYFGRLTEIAVQRFQAKHGIVNFGTPTTTGYGQVGPKTFSVMKAISGSIPTTTNTTGTPMPNVQLPTPTASTTTQTKTLTSRGGGGGGSSSGTSEPTVDSTAPIISNVRFDDDPIYEMSGDEDGYVDIGWDTNESATGRIYANTSFPVNISTAKVVTTAAATDMDAGFELSEDDDPGVVLFDTTYYFLIVVTDLSGNSATSSSPSYTFTTGHPNDDTNPIISNIVVSNITSSSASITWQITDTSPLSNAMEVDYGTVSGLRDLFQVPNAYTGSAPNYTRTLDLTDLSANTTYYFMIHEEDFAANQDDSTEESFTTLNI